MPYAPTPLQLRLEHDHRVKTPEGEELLFAAGEEFTGWGWIWRGKGPAGTHEASTRTDLPDSFCIEVHFLTDGRSWMYSGEITQRLLRPRPDDQPKSASGVGLDTPAFNLFDMLDALVPWPAGVRPRSEIPRHITGCSYAMTLGGDRCTVQLDVANERTTYERPVESLLFLPACRYTFGADGSFSRREEHVEPYSSVLPTPEHGLVRAVETGDPAIIRAAFRAHPSYVNRHLPGNTGFFLILHAIGLDRMDLLDLALELGADPNLDTGLSAGGPLHFAVQRDRPAMLSRLLAAGADPSAFDVNGETALHRAAKQGKAHLAELLVGAGAREVASAATGLTPSQTARLREFHEAVRQRDLGALSAALRDSPAFVDADLDGKNSLLIAARDGSVEVLELLAPLSRGLDRLVGPPETPWGPLHCAVVNRKLEAARVLLRHGADPRTPLPAWTSGGSTTPAGTRPLHIAADVNSRPLARLLLDAGADVDPRTDAGETPLTMAASHHAGHKLVELLLQRGADTGARNAQGESALDRARRLRHERVAALLEGR